MIADRLMFLASVMGSPLHALVENDQMFVVGIDLVPVAAFAHAEVEGHPRGGDATITQATWESPRSQVRPSTISEALQNPHFRSATS